MFPSCRAAGRPGGRVRGGSLLSYSVCTQSVLRSVHLPACLSACLSGRGRRLTVAECGAGVGIAAMAVAGRACAGVCAERKGATCKVWFVHAHLNVHMGSWSRLVRRSDAVLCGEVWSVASACSRG